MLGWEYTGETGCNWVIVVVVKRHRESLDGGGGGCCVLVVLIFLCEEREALIPGSSWGFSPFLGLLSLAGGWVGLGGVHLPRFARRDSELWTAPQERLNLFDLRSKWIGEWELPSRGGECEGKEGPGLSRGPHRVDLWDQVINTESSCQKQRRTRIQPDKQESTERGEKGPSKHFMPWRPFPFVL